jgi:hypothetical protein
MLYVPTTLIPNTSRWLSLSPLPGVISVFSKTKGSLQFFFLTQNRHRETLVNKYFAMYSTSEELYIEGSMIQNRIGTKTPIFN